MSEYQYYEWQTIDRLLSEAEQDAVDALSSHIDVTASRAVVTYEWGDFKHNPRQVLARYFDAHLYFANWGTRIVMFRFPLGLVDEDGLAPYLVDDSIQLSTEGKAQVLEIRFEEEEPRWEDFAGELSGMVSLRNDVLAGDYRCLYLAWLRALALRAEDEEGELGEPPVPAGLGQLTPALRRFAKFIDLDPHLITSAAAASPAQAPAPSDAALRQALGKLSRAEADDFLLRLLQGEAGLSLALKHRLQSELPAQIQRAGGGGRTAAELFAGAQDAQRQAAERQAVEAEQRRIAALQQLAQRAEQAWQTVEAQLAGRQWTYHVKAVEQLQQLRDLADYQQTRAAFDRRIKQLRERYAGRASIMKRLAEAKLV